MSPVSIASTTSQSMSAPAPATPKEQLANVVSITAEGQEPRSNTAVEITQAALQRIRITLVQEGISLDEGGIRLGITGGGCSGLSYKILFDKSARARDNVFVFGAGVETPDDPTGTKPVRLFIDPKSFVYLASAVLDYEDGLMHQGFHFINPNSTKSCGCGTSFSV